MSAPHVSVAEGLGRFVEVVDSCAPGLLEGLYVVGSFALDDWQPGHSDIDVIAVTAEPATDDDFAVLRTANAILLEQQPLPHVDGPWVSWGDLITPPMSLHRPWTLDGGLRHDGDCFELNPVTWYVLARQGVTVRGPSVDRLGVYLDTDARVRFVVDNLGTYWASLADDLERVTAGDDGRAYDAGSLEWCALGALRLHRTAFHGDVISKSAAAAYGLEIAPARFHGVLGRAAGIRVGDPASVGDGTAAPAELRTAGELIAWCVDDVERAAGRSGRRRQVAVDPLGG
jgi:hypothetical protein